MLGFLLKNLIGEKENDGWMNAMEAFDHSRPAISSHAVGNARGAMEEALQYSKERKLWVNRFLIISQYHL